MLAARKIWYCINPRLEPRDEQAWASDHGARLSNSVWEVNEVLHFGYAGGGVNFRLAQEDGRLVEVFMTQ